MVRRKAVTYAEAGAAAGESLHSDGTASPSLVERRARELGSLNAIAEVLNRTDAISEALTRTLTIVAEVLGLHSGWVWLLDEHGAFTPAATFNLPPHLQDPENMLGRLCHCLRTFDAGDLRGAANVNVLSCSRLFDVVDGTDGLRYHASVPIYLGGRKIGVLNVAMPQWRELAAEELQFLYTVGYLVGLAVEQKRLLVAQARLAQVEERNRLAREIHDTVAQSLAGLLLRLEVADALLGRDLGRGIAALHDAEALARGALVDVRRSVLDLRAAPLEGLALREALQRLVDEFGLTTGVNAAFTFAGAEPALSPRIELAAFRVAQEALANVAAHSGAGNVSVTLAIATGEPPVGPWLRLTVEDDGRGFDAAPVAGHFGLVGMHERARLLGGTLDLASSVDAGTRVTLLLPLAAGILTEMAGSASQPFDG